MITTRHKLGLLVLAIAMLAAACLGATPSSTTTPASTTRPPTSGNPPPSTWPTVPVPTYIDGNGFNDHSVPIIRSIPEFFALARTGVSGQSVVKFSIADMTFSPAISWMDSNFYTLHDEWYWFRLLNGADTVGGFEPIQGRRFETVAAIYDWARVLPPGELPFDLKFVASQSVGNRLYSDHFYDLALNVEPRVYGLGSLAYFPTSAGGSGPRWVIELEYHDDPTPDEVAEFFRNVAASVPAEIGEALEWVVRSPEQERIAQAMAAAALPFHDRIVRYRELVEPGTVAIYNEGIAAGRLFIIGPGGKDISDAGENDILLVENVPDWLPPGRALISSAPQTPLAHVNLLARNRGIPNASQAGILQNAGIQQAARVRAPAIVRAGAGSGLEIVLITEQQYRTWTQLNSVVPVAVPPVDADSLPHVVDLGLVGGVATEDDLARWRPVIGGKAAGFLNLKDAGAISLPDSPQAITVRPYLEHVAKVGDVLDAVLADNSFRESARTRYLLLEGPDAFAAFYTEEADREFAAAFAAAHPAGTPLGDVLIAGGFQEYLQSIAMDRAALRHITSELEAAYGHYALSQGLRFRSSSTVEDIEGFNGAGLYDSNTGFFRPDIQLDDADQIKSIEWAVKRTWASYWNFAAFEERRREGVDHRSGAMAILVHARFDDELELGNGVLTFTILPGGDDVEMLVNVQDGPVSVTNPDPALGALPEVLTVRRQGAGRAEISRIDASNLVSPGERVLEDWQVIELFGQAERVAVLWRERVNASLPAAQRIETLTLDFEFKEMDAGWPALRANPATNPARLVIKQARSLEIGLRHVPPPVRALPIPRDVLARARLVERVVCPAQAGGSVVAVEVLTDPLLTPDIGYAARPFVVVEVPGDIGDPAECSREILFSTPDQFLIELLEDGELLNLSR